jgi:hypothetical protein
MNIGARIMSGKEYQGDEMRRAIDALLTAARNFKVGES